MSLAGHIALRSKHAPTVVQLKHIAFLMGLPLAGAKYDIVASIDNAKSMRSSSGSKRIVSVDMGIRNLAYCVVETPASGAERPKVTAWKRRDLLDTGAEQEALESLSTAAASRMRRASVLAAVRKTAFTPASLSKTAYSVTQELLSHKPSQILIEQQRFRSGGAAAIQEWTVRVNMLESMLWACLITLKEQSSGAADAFPAIEAVAPARVASFWAAARDIGLRDLEHLELYPDGGFSSMSKATGPGVLRNKIDKQDKVNIVRSWLSGESKDMDLNFVGEAADVAEVFREKPARGKKSSAASESAIGKLDDLADCLLQAMAWMRWEENRKRLRKMLSDAADRSH